MSSENRQTQITYVHILVDYHPEDAAFFLSYVSKRELKESTSRRNARKRNEYLISRGFIKSVLRQQDSFDAAQRTLVRNGKGELCLNSDDNYKLSLSHTSNAVAFTYCTSLHSRVAVDIELKNERRNRTGIAENFFPVSERTISKEAVGFFTLWTQKEALAKLLGFNLPEALVRPVGELKKSYQLWLHSSTYKQYCWSIASTGPATLLDISYYQCNRQDKVTQYVTRIHHEKLKLNNAPLT